MTTPRSACAAWASWNRGYTVVGEAADAASGVDAAAFVRPTAMLRSMSTSLAATATGLLKEGGIRPRIVSQNLDPGLDAISPKRRNPRIYRVSKYRCRDSNPSGRGQPISARPPFEQLRNLNATPEPPRHGSAPPPFMRAGWAGNGTLLEPGAAPETPKPPS